MNPLTTFPNVSATTVKLSLDLSNAVRLRLCVQKRGFHNENWLFFKANLPPKDNVFAEKPPHHAHHCFCSSFEIPKIFQYRFLGKGQTL